MNVGISFNINNIKAYVSKTYKLDSNYFELENIIAVSDKRVDVGEKALNQFLVDKKATLYNLEEILELNGIIIDNRQISVERCLAFLFDELISNIKKHSGENLIGFVSVTIPYDKYYLWNEFISKAFLFLGIEKVRIISQPSAFFAQEEKDYLYALNRTQSKNQEEIKVVSLQESEKYKKDLARYNNQPWYKKLISKKPEYIMNKTFQNEGKYIFLSFSQNNLNMSLVEYGDGVLEIQDTQYSNNFSEGRVAKSVFDYFIKEINKNEPDVSTEDISNTVRIRKLVTLFLCSSQGDKFYEINLPNLLCENGTYKDLNLDINLLELDNFLSPIMEEINKQISKLIEQMQNEENKKKYPTKIKDIINVIIVANYLGNKYVCRKIEDEINKVYPNFAPLLKNEKNLASGALGFSNMMSGDKKDFLGLEVIPFSVYTRLNDGQLVELINKDTTIPTSRSHHFQLSKGGNDIQVHLVAKEGDNLQSVNIWKILAKDLAINNFEIEVNVDVFNKITLQAFYGNKQKIMTEALDTFSFDGTGFEVGIKGEKLSKYILNQFNYLSSVLKIEEISIFEPNNDFYEILKTGDLFKALRSIGYSLKLKSLPDIKFEKSAIFEERGSAGFIKDRTIYIPDNIKSDYHSLGNVVAHELAHYILIHEEGILLDDEQENEILTEIFIVYKGLGKLLLNGFNDKRGYLNKEIIKYIFDMYFKKHNIDIDDFKKNLTKDGLQIIK